MLEACRSVIAATLFYGTDLYHYVKKVHGKYGGSIKIRGIDVCILPRVSFPLLPPALIRSSQSTHNTLILPAQLTRMPRNTRDALDQLMFIKHGEAQT